MQNYTYREQIIIKLLIKGKTNKEIADELFISFHTVKSILEKIYDKAKIHNRVQLAIMFSKYFNESDLQLSKNTKT